MHQLFHIFKLTGEQAKKNCGINRDPWGNEKAGFSIQGKINRRDWGLNWNAALEAGGVLVSDEVKIFAEIQLVKQG